MSVKTTTTTCALACAAILAVPAGASAAGFSDSLDYVQAHTAKADRALDRAAKLLARDRDAEASRSFATSRRELARAKRRAALLDRRADSSRERAIAAEANEVVADEQDENVTQLAGMLDEARGRVENRIAQAALSDARGRDKAIAVISAILGEGVSGDAAEGLTRALSSLAQGRDEEVEELAETLAGDGVSSRNQRRLARAVEESVDGQAQASARLSELIASADMPEESRAGLQRAFDAVTAEQERSAETLSAYADRLPSFIRSFVVGIVEQARENAQGMRDNRPQPPYGDGERGAPEGTSGQPEGTSGQPEGTSSWPEGTQDGGR